MLVMEVLILKMLTYYYKCKNCLYELEIKQKIIEESLKTCPHCNLNKLERIIQPVNFKLKGEFH